MLKGIVRLEFVDVETGKVNREITKENFVFFENYPLLWRSTNTLQRPCIVGRGTDVYPYYDKNKDYFGRHHNVLTGYAPAGTQLKKFFQKTDDSPAYWDFYSLFLPPSTTATIPCISLTYYSGDNVDIPSGASPGNDLVTALNLDPYCYQSPTEYLNVYYRLIMIEDDKNLSPDFIRNQFILDIDRGSSKIIFPNLVHKTYPFRIEQDLTRTGYTNFVSIYHWSLGNKNTVYPSIEHGKLVNAEKTYTYPDENPNQYTQINYGLVNTVVRGFGSAFLRNFSSISGSLGIRVGVNPIKITPTIATGFTGIGNVFSASANSSSTIFDAANFPAGSGRMQIAGILSNIDKDPFPTTFQAEITKAGQHWDSAEYRVYEHRLLDNHQGVGSIPLPLLPYATLDNSDTDTYYFTDLKAMMFKEPEKIHFSERVVKYIEDRAFITWDNTGITVYDIYHGKLEPFDINTVPSLAVTRINDVKVDNLANIWVSCADTGLWKLKIVDEDEIELTHIGVLPGSQQKCYGIDIDNFGNLFAIFWGTGLFYTSDYGNTWVNVPIDYAPLSGFESGGFVSKWSYVARMICNPERNATLGTAQLLILLSTNSPDYAASGGCWYDQQSQISTGITNAAMKSQLASQRTNRFAENVKVSDYHNTWFFLNGGSQVFWCTFQNNASMTSYTNGQTSGCTANILDKEWSFDTVAGVNKEYLYIGIPVVNRHTTSPTTTIDIFDIATKTVVSRVPIPNINSQWVSSDAAGGIKLGKNLFISLTKRYLYSIGYNNRGFIVSNAFPFLKSSRQWGAKSWGWNGSQWVKDYVGNKPIHLTNSDLFRGAQNKFTDGHVATQSWVLGDTFTFTAFDGFFKDNSSTMALRDTVYYKPTDVCEAFTPNFVTRIDKTLDVGLLNSNPIELDWDISELPDTNYNGENVVVDGDPYFSNVSFLALYNDTTGMNPTVGTYETTTGLPVMDSAYKIFGNDSLKLNGTSGFSLAPSILLSPSSTFTLEMMISPSETGSKMHLFDFRSASNQSAAFYISTSGKLGIEIAGVSYGDLGQFLFPGTTYYVKFKRVGNRWSAYVNDVEQFFFDNANAFQSPAPLHLFKRFSPNGGNMEAFKGWAANVRVTRAIARADTGVPSGYFPTKGNSYSGAALVLSGNYNQGSIVSTHELVGDWEVIFHGLTAQTKGTRRSRPKLAFGVSVQKFIESVTDISYRCCGTRIGTFLQSYDNSTNYSTITDLKITKTGEFIDMYYSTTNGSTWVDAVRNIRDLNPLHHIAFWQVQADETPMETPSVEIVKNGSAIFSKIGTAASQNGYFAKKFLCADVYYETDINISLQGVKVTKARSNFLTPAQPLEGEVLAMQAGTLVFHENDIGKSITGKMITLRD